jgi:hypothetical protein
LKLRISGVYKSMHQRAPASSLFAFPHPSNYLSSSLVNSPK